MPSFGLKSSSRDYPFLTPLNVYTVGTADASSDTFSQVRPELDEYTKEPPPLPPHLRHIILNKVCRVQVMERKSRRPIRLKSEKLERAPKPKRICSKPGCNNLLLMRIALLISSGAASERRGSLGSALARRFEPLVLHRHQGRHDGARYVSPPSHVLLFPSS